MEGSSNSIGRTQATQNFQSD